MFMMLLGYLFMSLQCLKLVHFEIGHNNIFYYNFPNGLFYLGKCVCIKFYDLSMIYSKLNCV